MVFATLSTAVASAPASRTPESVSVPAAAPPAAAGADTRLLEFDVFLGEREIGWQRFRLQRDGAATRVETEARFTVKLLGVTAFAYDHRNVELWRDGCLQAIDSRTNSNGTEYKVEGRARGTSFRVDSRSGARTLPDCVGSFAYWDPRELVGRQRLLNPQTGEYVEVDVLSLGAGNVTLGGRRVAVTRYALRGKDLDITVAYEEASGEWVALESRLGGDRLLRYERSDVRVATTGGGQARTAG
jgi:hypothetical protein